MDFDDYSPQIIGLGVIFVLLLAWTLVIVIGYSLGVIRNNAAQIYLQAGGVVAGTILIGIYLVLILHQRQETEQERLRWLFADVITYVIEPARERALENRNKLESGQFDWTLADPLSELETLSRDLGTESTHIERFEKRFSELYEDMEYHDNEQRVELVRAGQEIRRELEGPLVDYFEKHPVGFSGSNEELAHRMIRIFLNGDSYWKSGGPVINKEFHQYLNHSVNIYNLIEEIPDIDYEGYEEKKSEYFDLCYSIYCQLGKARDEIRQDYPIPSAQLRDTT